MKDEKKRRLILHFPIFVLTSSSNQSIVCSTIIFVFDGWVVMMLMDYIIWSSYVKSSVFILDRIFFE